jgi:uncharacterized protein (DUF2237 family)
MTGTILVAAASIQTRDILSYTKCRDEENVDRPLVKPVDAPCKCSTLYPEAQKANLENAVALRSCTDCVLQLLERHGPIQMPKTV